MLYKAIEAVILLSFLFALVLEVIIGYILIQHDVRKYKGRSISVPTPRKIIRKHKAIVRNEKDRKKFETLLSNIDAYDGTTFGQKDLE